MAIGVSASELGFLFDERWFAGKARRVERAEVVATAPLADNAVATLVRAVYADGGSETYFVPLVSADGNWTDGLADEQVCRQLLQLIADKRAIGATTPSLPGVPPNEDGELRGVRLRFFDEADGIGTGTEPIRPASHDQSNSAVSFGDRWFLKVFRKVEPGINPDYEIARYLTEQGQFTRLPRMAGAIEFQPHGGPAMTLATLQEMVPNDGSAWAAMLSDVDSSLKSGQPMVLRVELLGRRTAELHLALSRESKDPAFRSEPLTIADCQTLATRLRRGASEVFAALEASSATLDSAVSEQARTLLDSGPLLVERIAKLLTADPHCTKQRIHGDYHLGQVLCQGDDFIILDFEGEPARPLAERRAKDSPLRDVAGMLRSFGYAAYAGLFAHAETNPYDYARCEPMAIAWQKAASAAYLKGYFEVAKNAPFLPADDKQLATLLDFFVVEKALYEVHYELNNRPTWLKIPLTGILAIAQEPRS